MSDSLCGGDDCLNCLALVPAEGFPHSVSGAGAGEPQSGAGHQEQAAAPAGEDDDGARQAGERRSFVTDHRDIKGCGGWDPGGGAITLNFIFFAPPSPERQKCEAR